MPDPLYCQDVKSWNEDGQELKTKTGGRRDQDCDQAFSWTRFLVERNLYCERHFEDRRRSCRLDSRVTFGWVTGPNWLLRGGGHQCTRWEKQENQWTLTSEIFRNLWELLPALSRDLVNWRWSNLMTLSHVQNLRSCQLASRLLPGELLQANRWLFSLPRVLFLIWQIHSTPPPRPLLVLGLYTKLDRCLAARSIPWPFL